MPPTFADALDELDNATEHLLRTAGKLDDSALREPSRLPGWTRGHVLTHVCRSAEGLVNLAIWASTGVERPMYASAAAREADIEAGAARSATELVKDLRDTADRLRSALADLPPEVMGRTLRLASGSQLTGADLPSVRQREVEIHHVDLGAGYTPAHWSDRFAERTLDQLQELFRTARDTPVRELQAPESGRTWVVGATGPTLSGQPSALLAWLTGRSDGDGLTLEPAPDNQTPIPAAPRW